MARIELTPQDGAQPTCFARGRIHSVETMGTVDGPGIRFVVFVQGCPMRCLYCHNPDTWATGEGAGSEITVERLVDEFESNRQFYRNGGVTVSGGEPLLQADFVADLFAELHARPRGRVHTCLDTCGYAFDPAHPERTARLLDECDLGCYIKHRPRGAPRAWPRPCAHSGVDELHAATPVVIRHVIVPAHRHARGVRGARQVITAAVGRPGS